MHAESVLEFEALRAVVGRYIRSPLGAAEDESVQPSSDRGAIETALADTAEAVAFARAASEPQAAARGAAIRVRFDLNTDLAPVITRLRIEGATLEGHEILDLSRLLDLAGEARSVLISAAERFPRLAGYAAGIADLRGA